MLTLLPAVLTVCGRRAFWPFVPHTPDWQVAKELPTTGIGKSIVEGSTAGALLRVIGGALIVVVLLPLVLVNWLLRRITGGRLPSLIVGPLDRRVFKPYELRRFQHEHQADATHGFWKRAGDWVARQPGRVAIGVVVVLLVMIGGFATFSTDLTTQDSYRTSVESVEGQELISKSFPAGESAPTDVIVPSSATWRP